MFKISGKERRKLKKELSQLRTVIGKFWYYEDLEEVYGTGLEQPQERLNELKAEAESLSYFPKKFSVLYFVSSNIFVYI